MNNRALEKNTTEAPWRSRRTLPAAEYISVLNFLLGKVPACCFFRLSLSFLLYVQSDEHLLLSSLLYRRDGGLDFRFWFLRSVCKRLRFMRVKEKRLHREMLNYRRQRGGNRCSDSEGPFSRTNEKIDGTVA